MDVELTEEQVSCGSSEHGHHWMAIRMELGSIVGVDSSGAPIFIPDDIKGIGADQPSHGDTAYGCAHCDVPWTPELTVSPI